MNVLINLLKEFLFISPKLKFLKMLSRRTLRNSWSIFLVRSKTGPLLMSGSTTFMYIGSFERGVVDVLECLFNFLGRGLFVDVGAYVGFYSIFAAKRGWRVLAFEPNPVSLVLLKYNITMNNVGDFVSVVGKAVGERTDVADLTLGVVPSWSSLTSYIPQSAVLGKVKVEIVPLDLMLENLTEGPLVIKVDVEGAGLSVLKGALKSINKFRPYIIFEVHRTDEIIDELKGIILLKRLGYIFGLLEQKRSVENFVLLACPYEKGCPCGVEALHV